MSTESAEAADSTVVNAAAGDTAYDIEFFWDPM